MDAPADPVSRLLPTQRLTAIADIGANPIDGDPPYKSMLQRGLCTVVGFEPQPEALAALNARKSVYETYFPYVIGDGHEGTFRVCSASGMSSLLAPDNRALRFFAKFPEWGRVITETPVATRQLDDIAEIENLDLLKIDVQGSELTVFRHGHRLLSRAVAVHTEVSFFALYKDQPTQGEIDAELRSLGFIPHMFAEIRKRVLAPLVDDQNPHRELNQLLEADIIYVRDFTKADAMSNEQLAHLARIAHFCYKSYDLAMNCLVHLERRQAVGVDYLDSYMQLLQNPVQPPA